MLLHLFFLSVLALVSAFLARVFTVGLEGALAAQASFPYLVFLLPVVLFVTRFSERVLERLARSENGEPRHKDVLQGYAVVPLTWLSHCAGASVGREGVAVQLGRSVAKTLASVTAVQGPWCREEALFKYGVASGFAAIFGTPFAAAVFAFEFFRTQNPEPRQVKWMNAAREAVPVFFSAFLSHQFATRLFGMRHTQFLVPNFEFSSAFFAFVMIVVLGAFFAARLHEAMTRSMKTLFFSWHQRHMLLAYVPSVLLLVVLSLPPFIPHRNLGTYFIEGVLSHAQSPLQPSGWEWWCKSFVTSLSVAAGFRGGEVTPLFSMGVLLAYPLSFLFKVPAAKAAATGFASLFACVMRAPWTGVILSFELFGWEGGLGGALVCALLAILLNRTRTTVLRGFLFQRRQA
ncbi:MAG: hypothetical protein RIR26_342 [Pseudomonadota bacterium]